MEEKVRIECEEMGEEVGGADSFLRASQFFHICSAGLYVKIHLEPLRRFALTPSAQEELQPNFFFLFSHCCVENDTM